MPEVEAAREEVYPRTQGKTAMIFVGGSRAHHYQELFNEMGMKTMSAGYEFGHRDDYEGRQVLPHSQGRCRQPQYRGDRGRGRSRALPAAQDRRRRCEALEADGLHFKEYEGLNPDMDKGSIIIDDLNQYEAEKLVQLMKPDLFCAGIKEKYSIQKLGMPQKQLHSYDSGGPYAGFKGAVNFYHEIDRLVNSKVWGLMKAPWQENPELSATYVWE